MLLSGSEDFLVLKRYPVTRWDDDIVHRFRFINQVPLNASNQDLLVNFVEYWQTTPKKTMHFSWVTDMEVTEENVFEIMRGGRARSQN